MKKLEETLRSKLSAAPSEQLDRKFWNRFEREFGKAPSRRSSTRSRFLKVLLPAAITAILLVVVQFNRTHLFDVAKSERETNAGLEIVMDRELYENLEAFSEITELEEQIPELSYEEFATLAGM